MSGVIGRVGSAYVKAANLREFKKQGILMLPTVAYNITKVHGVITKVKAGELTTAVEAGLRGEQLLQRAQSVVHGVNTLKGRTYFYCVHSGIEAYMLNEFKDVQVDSNLIMRTGHRVNTEVSATNEGEDWAFRIECAMGARSPVYLGKLQKHGNDFFYLVCTGYDLTPRIIKHLLAGNCQPVVTVGSPYPEVISFDQMLYEIKETIIETRHDHKNTMMA
jgi:hypothetical protein